MKYKLLLVAFLLGLNIGVIKAGNSGAESPKNPLLAEIQKKKALKKADPAKAKQEAEEAESKHTAEEKEHTAAAGHAETAKKHRETAKQHTDTATKIGKLLTKLDKSVEKLTGAMKTVETENKEIVDEMKEITVDKSVEEDWTKAQRASEKLGEIVKTGSDAVTTLQSSLGKVKQDTENLGAGAEGAAVTAEAAGAQSTKKAAASKAAKEAALKKKKRATDDIESGQERERKAKEAKDSMNKEIELEGKLKKLEEQRIALKKKMRNADPETAKKIKKTELPAIDKQIEELETEIEQAKGGPSGD